jgi:hypothetical protein
LDVRDIVDVSAPSVQPIITGTVGLEGWYVSDVNVGWQVGDPDSPVLAAIGCDGGSVTSDTSGAEFTCSATSVGGTATSAVTVQRDTAPPHLDVVVTPAEPNGSNGWYTSSVDVQFVCADDAPGSGVASCPDAARYAHGVNSWGPLTVSDRAGHTSNSVEGTVWIDTTPPVIEPSVSGPAGDNGWYAGAVTVGFAPSDPDSGISNTSGCDTVSVMNSDGSAMTCTATNGAGLEASESVVVKVDAEPPTIDWVDGPQPDASYEEGSVPAAGSCVAVDNLSGSGSCAVAGYGTSVGTYVLTATARDVAGNTAVETRVYEVVAPVVVEPPVQVPPADEPPADDPPAAETPAPQIEADQPAPTVDEHDVPECPDAPPGFFKRVVMKVNWLVLRASGIRSAVDIRDHLRLNGTCPVPFPPSKSVHQSEDKTHDERNAEDDDRSDRSAHTPDSPTGKRTSSTKGIRNAR